MKLSGLQENIKQGLNIVSHIASKNINLPILNNIKIETKEREIRLTTTNLEIGITHKIRGKIERGGSFTVNAKIITDYINLLPNKKINIEQREGCLIINCENYKTKIKGQPANEYPLIPEVERDIYYSVDINNFKNALAQVVFAASIDDSRVELSGALFSFNKDELTIAATDSYRLAEKRVSLKTNSNQEGKKIIVPVKTLQELIKILSSLQSEDITEEAREVKFYLSENQILFACGSAELVSRLIEGQYPDYKQIIPQNSKTNVIIDKNEFIRATKASSLFSKTGINDINLDFLSEKNKTTISSVSGQTGENITEINSKVSGDNNGIVVNYRYLLDGLNNINSEMIKVKILDGNTPITLKPENEDNYLYIIMPIKQ